MPNNHPQKTISVAPMMDWTDRHARYFLRLIAPAVQLYTEMITATAILYGDTHYLLDFHPNEKYVALQLGGCDPCQLAEAAKIGEAFGYDEINLNVGCPSPRVKKGRFGACLMLEPALVASCVSKMKAVVNLPVTVKCRIGVDEVDNEEALHQFVCQMVEAGCDKIIVHARKAWLSGLSPKQNRDIPPLRYDVVRDLKKAFPPMPIILNGGIKTLADIEGELPNVDGIMIGRAAYHQPWFLAEIQAHYFEEAPLSRNAIIQAFLPYVESQLTKGVKLHNMTRHVLGFFHGQAGAAHWRRYLSQHAHQANADVGVIEQALSLMQSFEETL